MNGPLTVHEWSCEDEKGVKVTISIPVAYQIEDGTEPGHPYLSGEANCGPACLAGLAVWAGWAKEATDDLVDSIRTEISGVDSTDNPPLLLATLSDWLVRYGASTHDIPLASASFDQWLALGQPIILLADNTKFAPVRYPGPGYFGRHFVVLTGTDGDSYTLGDPLLVPTATTYTKASVIDSALAAVAVVKPSPTPAPKAQPPVPAPKAQPLDKNAQLAAQLSKDEEEIKQLQFAVNQSGDAVEAAEAAVERVGYKPH